MKYTFKNLMAAAGAFEHYRGYRYLQQSVALALKNPEKLCNICAEIYQPIARVNHTRETNVHRNIRTLVGKFWSCGGDKLFVEWTDCTRWYYEKPYPKEFIAIIAQLIRDSQEESFDSERLSQVCGI